MQFDMNATHLSCEFVFQIQPVALFRSISNVITYYWYGLWEGTYTRISSIFRLFKKKIWRNRFLWYYNEISFILSSEVKITFIRWNILCVLYTYVSHTIDSTPLLFVTQHGVGFIQTKNVKHWLELWKHLIR